MIKIYFTDYKDKDAVFKNINAKKELAYFIFYYFFNVFGIPINDNTYLRESNNNVKNNILFFQSKKDLVFVEGKQEIYRFTCKRKLSKDEISLGRMLLDEFYKISKFQIRRNYLQNNYTSIISAELNYNLAIQQGICRWIVGDQNNRIDQLMQLLERWSVQTYEGKKVTFGFIVDKDDKNNIGDINCNVIEFLKDDYSATLTDCIDTIMEIDKEANLIGYRSITTGNVIQKTTIRPGIPYRFSNILNKFTSRKKTGIFLLNSGDIVLSRNKNLHFVKRNLRWLNITFEGFKSAYYSTTKKNSEISENLLAEIFASVLDVSFSHSGGIIAVISDPQFFNSKKQNEKTLSNVDFLMYKDGEINEYQDLFKEMGNELESNRNKRLLKRRFIKKLIAGNSFPNIDRKLRAELIAMDGACIIDQDANVCAIGAIIKNKSGSSEGGRGAACKILSNYGMGVKISTDGYIEMFIEGKLVYSIK